MTISDINSYISYRTNADTTIFPNSDRLIIANRWLHKIWSMILESQDAWDVDDINQTDYPLITTPLVASQRDYTLPASLKAVKINRVDITYDGSTYYRMTPLDAQMIADGLGNETKTDATFSKTSPYYDLRDNAIFIYPLPSSSDVSAGGKLRVEYVREFIELTDMTSTSSLSFDKPFHAMLGLGVCFDYASANGLGALKQDFWSELQDYETRLKKFYGDKDVDTKYRFSAMNINYF